MESKEFRKIVDKMFKSNGYYKKHGFWYKETDECISQFYLQHSRWGPYYYINLASFIKSEDCKEWDYIEELNHIHMRTPDAGPNGEPYLQTLNLGNRMSDEERRENIKDIIENYCLPWLQQLSTKAGIKQYYQDNPDKWYLTPLDSLGID